MRKSILAIAVIGLLSTSCNKAVCYDCEKDAGNKSKFCLPRSEAKSKKKALESEGYTCNKFKQ
jgi:hypothetical protein